MPLPHIPLSLPQSPPLRPNQRLLFQRTSTPHHPSPTYSPTAMPSSDTKQNTYTVYFGNSCDSDTSVSIDDESKEISADSCQLFSDQNYQDSVTYTESGSGERGGNVSCKNIASSNNSKCALLEMPNNACVIIIDLCDE